MLLTPRLNTATETTADLLKDGLASRRVALMSLFLVAAGTYMETVVLRINWSSYREHFFITEPL